jgi:hypothetical protein
MVEGKVGLEGRDKLAARITFGVGHVAQLATAVVVLRAERAEETLAKRNLGETVPVDVYGGKSGGGGGARSE